MASIAKRLSQRLRGLARSEDGTATIPVLIFVPFFLLFLLSSVEMGMLMIRHVLLERAVDQAKTAAAGLGESELTELIDEAVQWAREGGGR